jgi:hypothetical protein
VANGPTAVLHIGGNANEFERRRKTNNLDVGRHVQNLKIKGDFDPDFISHTIHYDHLWGFNWQYSGIPFERRSDPPEVAETVNCMDMWPERRAVNGPKSRHTRRKTDQGG